MSDSASTAKPAIAVIAGRDHRRAGRAVGAPQRHGGLVARRPLLAVAGGQQHRELGRDRDHQRAQRRRHRVQRHAQREQHERRPARGQRDRHERDPRALPAPVHREQREADREQAGQQRAEPAQRRGQRVVGLGAEHLQAREPRGHALGRVEPPLHLVHHALLLVERHQPHAERERRRLAVRGDHRLREVGRHRVEQRADASRGPCVAVSERNRSGSDSAGHTAAFPQPFLVE